MNGSALGTIVGMVARGLVAARGRLIDVAGFGAVTAGIHLLAGTGWSLVAGGVSLLIIGMGDGGSSNRERTGQAR